MSQAAIASRRRFCYDADMSEDKKEDPITQRILAMIEDGGSFTLKRWRRPSIRTSSHPACRRTAGTNT